jgi:thiamine-phosphate pyrophosphorylase
MSTNLYTGLYAITDPELLDEDNLFTKVESALKGGCRILQYRDKPASADQKLERARALKTLCNRYDAQLIINDDIELCLQSKADGVHLGKSDGDILNARRILGSNRILGVTCHSDLVYAQLCIDLGVDYCAFGRIFSSKTKPEAPPCSLSVLNEATKLNKPIVAIGGITLDNIESLMQTPIHNVAVIHGLFSQTDIEATARQYQDYFSNQFTSFNNL